MIAIMCARSVNMRDLSRLLYSPLSMMSGVQTSSAVDYRKPWISGEDDNKVSKIDNSGKDD